MGTIKDWTEVLVVGAFWGAWMLFWTGGQRWHKGRKRLVRIEDVLEWALMGLWFGTVMTFGWRRAFRMPLLPITIGSFVAACLLTRIRKIPENES